MIGALNKDLFQDFVLPLEILVLLNVHLRSCLLIFIFSIII